MAQTNCNIIKSAAKFLQTPAQPQRPLEEKIRFLIKEKKLTQYQLIAALKQANLYSIDTIEPILKMHYFEQNEKKNSSKKKRKDKKNQTTQAQKQESLNNSPSQKQDSSSSPSSSSSWSSWWSTATSIGIGIASFVASYTVSTTASQNIVKKSEDKTIKKLDVVKTEIKEQADLDRERQHRDLMEVVNLLKTQVQCVQQNLGVLKQSIDVIQTQMKFNNNNNNNNNININANNPNNSIHSKLKINNNANDDGTNSIISSNLSMNNERKPNLGVIGNLLSKNDDGLEWMDQNIITSDIDNNDDNNDKNKITESKNNDIDNNQSQNNNNNDNNINDDNDEQKEEKEEEIILIYHPDYKDMIKTLPTDITEIKHQLTDLLNLWQKMVNKNEKNKDNSDNDKDLNIDKIKAGVNALSFYINKILRKPFMEPPRKINTYNKQYKERLSNLPRIDELLTVIGYEKNENGVFWILPLLYNNKDSSNTNDDQDKKKANS